MQQVAVAQLERLVYPGARPGRNDGPAHGAADTVDIDLDRRLPAAIEDLPGFDGLDAIVANHPKPE